MKLIVIGGAPGTGKSTLARKLCEERRCPWIDFGRLREFHLLPDWSNQSPEEEHMAFENLLTIIRNYWRHGYPEVLVDDLRDHRITQMPHALPEGQVQILTLTLSNADQLRERIVTRNEGFTSQDAAVAWNAAVLQRDPVQGEIKMDVVGLSREEVFARAIALLG